MQIFGETISLSTGVFLLIALAMALSFEFVNGFHDTANAVATVIYTRSLRPVIAVVWSGCWNLIGVLASAGGVAFGVLALLPVELVLNVGSATFFSPGFSRCRFASS
jgi:inorganic phosphate transporter, PiT family